MKSICEDCVHYKLVDRVYLDLEIKKWACKKRYPKMIMNCESIAECNHFDLDTSNMLVMEN